MENYRERRGVVERYRWMGWLYTIVGCFIVALLVLMFLDMANYNDLDGINQESAPAMQITQPTISHFSSPTVE